MNNVRRNSIEKKFLIIGLILLSFGSLNLINSYAQTDDITNSNIEPSLTDKIIERLISEAMPILAGILSIGFSYLRKQGVQISAEAEKDFTDTAVSVVRRQSKWIYEQLRDNPTYLNELGNARIPAQLGKDAKENVLSELGKLIENEKFTSATKSMLRENLPEIVETLVTRNKENLSEKSRMLIEKLAPLAVDSILLNYKSKDEAQNDIDKIIKEAIASVREYFDTEEIIFHQPSIEMHVKANLNEKIGAVTA